MPHIKRTVLTALLIHPIVTLPTSLVYKFFVSEITRRYTSQTQNTSLSQISLWCFDTYASRYDSTHENATGLLATYIYEKNNVYAEVDGAFGHVRSHSSHRKFSRTQTDDILCSLGFSKAFSQKTAVTLSGILGFPTHKDTSPEGIQFGIAHGSIGFKIDAIRLCSPQKDHKLLMAGRYLRFLPATISAGSSISPDIYELDVGNLFDLLIGYNLGFSNDGLEFGYNPNFLVGGRLYPESAPHDHIGYMRSTFYLAYYHIFLAGKHPNILSFICSYTTEHKPKIYKQLITAFVTWSMLF
jgi:hypothetical protein